MKINILVLAIIFTAVFVVPIGISNHYDAWADYNSDGIIDIVDIAIVAQAWQTTGNPSRNVTIIYPEFSAVLAIDHVANASEVYVVPLPNGVTRVFWAVNLTQGSIYIDECWTVGGIMAKYTDCSNFAPYSWIRSDQRMGEALVLKIRPYNTQTCTYSLFVWGDRP